jgi:hypothetical protein
MANVRFDSEIKYHQSKYHVDYMVYHNGDTTEQEVSAHKGHKAPKGTTKGEVPEGEVPVPEGPDPSISS